VNSPVSLCEERLKRLNQALEQTDSAQWHNSPSCLLPLPPQSPLLPQSGTGPAISGRDRGLRFTLVSASPVAQLGSLGDWHTFHRVFKG
jgi:hypothetical protein